MTIAPAHPLTTDDLQCLANARLVLPDRVVTGRIEFAGGVITALEEGGGVPEGALDCGGDLVMPGLVELHTDNLERHIEPRAGVAWPHDAALIAHDAELASIGITTVFDALRVGSIHKTQETGGYRKYARELASEIIALRAAGALKISHFIHLRAEVCSETLIEEFAEFGPEDRIGLISMMDHTPGQRQFRDPAKLYQYINKKRGMTPAQFDAHVAHLKALRARHGEAHESATVREAARLGAALASHDDTTAEQVAASRDHGMRLAEFPTTAAAAEACREAGIAIMMGAPNVIRGGSHSGNVSALDLADRGLLDILSSDYVPGALLLAAFRLADRWDDLPRAIATVTRNPAEAVGMTDRGRLAPGRKADFIRLARHRETPIIRGVWSHGRQVG
jgi:alpha-D-ribose 1-methylphosphonate 5-triphosphate diphosphatase